MISSWVRSFVLGLPLFSSERPMDLFAFLTQFPVEFSIDDFPSTSTGNPCDSKISYLVCPLECRSMNSSMNSLVKDTYLGVTDLTQGLDRSIETCSSVKRMPAIKKTSDESVIGGNLFGRVFFLDCPNYGVQFIQSPVIRFGKERIRESNDIIRRKVRHFFPKNGPSSSH